MSKGLEALEELLYYANLNFERENERKTEFANKIEKMGIADNEENFKIIEKDLDQLEEYRKIEEELGIDLIKAVELCKQVNSKKVVYTKERWGIDTIKILDELDIELFSHRLYKNFGGVYVSLDLYEYGKTWALTKEELEQ